MFQLDAKFSSVAPNDFGEDVAGVALDPLLLPDAIANENQPKAAVLSPQELIADPGNIAWEDDEYYYVFED